MRRKLRDDEKSMFDFGTEIWVDKRGDYYTTPGLSRAEIKGIRERAKTLVDTFSINEGSGSVLTSCEKKSCRWPYCLCVTR